MDNDLAALAEAENWFGAGRTHDRFIVLTVGAGMGFGYVCGREVVTSPDSGLGLVWSVPVRGYPDGGPVLVHNDQVVSIPAMERRAGEVLGRNVGFAELLELAREGETDARDLVDHAAEAVGELIGAAATFTLPQVVVISGEGSGFLSLARDRMEAGIARVWNPLAEPLKVIVRDHDFAHWARGSATLAIQHSVLDHD